MCRVYGRGRRLLDAAGHYDIPFVFTTLSAQPFWVEEINARLAPQAYARVNPLTTSFSYAG